MKLQIVASHNPPQVHRSTPKSANNRGCDGDGDRVDDSASPLLPFLPSPTSVSSFSSFSAPAIVSALTVTVHELAADDAE